MKCEDFQAHLLDGPTVRPEPGLAEHLLHCPDCRELQALWLKLNELEQPEVPQGMSSRFRERLAIEVAKQATRPSFTNSWWLPLSVAATVLVALGVGLGFSLRSDRDQSDLSSAGLRNGSTADRMEAIALVNSRTPGQGDIVTALMERISNDPSVEVRLSAVEALYLFNAEATLTKRIEEVLPRQSRSEVQLALIDLLGALRQKRAAEALHRLIQEDQLPTEARRRAEQRLSQMNL